MAGYGAIVENRGHGVKRTTVVWAIALGLTACRLAHAEELDLGALVRPVPATARFADPDYFIWCGAPTKGDDGKYHLFDSNVERPALLLDGETPVALFGATDGYRKNGRISCNVQIPLETPRQP